MKQNRDKKSDSNIVESSKLLLFSCDSLIGGRDENQDSYGYLQENTYFLAVVCDGMGGHNGGKFASESAVQVILQDFKNSGDSNITKRLLNAISKANSYVYSKSQEMSELRGMGTTVVALYVDKNFAITAHVGDSRIYQMRKGKAIFRTNDHSKVAELVRRGVITEEQARLSDESNILTNALGIKPQIEVSFSQKLSFNKNDRFLLCTDGISGSMPEGKLLDLANSNGSPETSNKILCEKIDIIGNQQGGGHDNLTSIIIDMNMKSKYRDIMNKKNLIIGILAIIVVFSIAMNAILLINKDNQPTDKIDLIQKDDTTSSKNDTTKNDTTKKESAKPEEEDVDYKQNENTNIRETKQSKNIDNEKLSKALNTLINNDVNQEEKIKKLIKDNNFLTVSLKGMKREIDSLKRK